MKRYERLWERLLTLLGTLGEVDASTPGRLKLVIDKHEIELVMTEREWDDLVSIPYGSFVGAAAELLNVLRRAPMDGLPYVVYDTYELHLCATPEPPVQAELEEDRRRVEEFLQANPGAQLEWRAYPPDRDDVP